MNNSAKAKAVLDMIRDSYKDTIDAQKRSTDRITIILGITATCFSLIAKVDDAPAEGVAKLFLICSMIGLLACFVITVLALYPRDSKVPGSFDVHFLWNHYVSEVSEEQCFANIANDICDAWKWRVGMVDSFARLTVVQLFASGITLFCVAISEFLAT
ncbi:MAG: hypothetical protein JNM43_16335 [Planctomycetaceae bacterium]|nr:hypothetical protein [Planctomycetaceae bacterium]